MTDYAYDKLTCTPSLDPAWKYGAGVGMTIDILRGLSFNTVIRWYSGIFLYTALKTDRGWYTSATEANSYVDQILTDGALANILGDLEFAVATSWEKVHAPPF